MLHALIFNTLIYLAAIIFAWIYIIQPMDCRGKGVGWSVGGVVDNRITAIDEVLVMLYMSGEIEKRLSY